MAAEGPCVAAALKRFLFAVLLGLGADALGQPAGAQSCANCHGARGEGGLTGAPLLAGLAQAYLERQLAAYADGTREHSVMTPIAKRLTLQERAQLAAYYAGLRAPPAPPQISAITIPAPPSRGAPPPAGRAPR
jgi:cytochrome c553